MRINGFIVALTVLFSSAALAGQARVCESTNIKFTTNDKIYLTNDVIYDCGDNIKGTLMELSNSGWNIRQVISTDKVDKFLLLIEK